MRNGWISVTQNMALINSKIQVTIKDFGKGARLAREAGLDGVELHAANSRLLDPFLQDNSNKRTDDNGSSPLKIVLSFYWRHWKNL